MYERDKGTAYSAVEQFVGVLAAIVGVILAIIIFALAADQAGALRDTDLWDGTIVPVGLLVWILLPCVAGSVCYAAAGRITNWALLFPCWVILHPSKFVSVFRQRI